MLMEATAARQTILQNTIYKQKKGLPRPTHDSRKPLYQAVYASLPFGNSAGTAYLHCIKDGTNIDPPYNTGNDSFLYPDKYEMDKEKFEEIINLKNDEGNINFKQNLQSNPRFHSDWCSMIYPRLKLAKYLLTEDGVIFISISDDEEANLRKICDENYGENNFIGELTWESTTQPDNIGKARYGLQKRTEFILFYSKNNKNLLPPFVLKLSQIQKNILIKVSLGIVDLK